MKNSVIIIVFMLVSVMATAQYTVSGKVIDSASVAVSFSNVVLKNAETDEIVAGGISDEEGKFSLNAPSGNFLLDISFIGYQTFQKNLDLKSDLKIGDITLSEAVNSLEEVVIRGKRPVIEREADRLTFNVQNSIMASGGNMSDVLKVTPGLKIEDEGLSIIGKGNVRVMINGRQLKLTGAELVNFLNSIPASNIAKVEVIDAPPSRYDAEGSSGLVNIIYKKGVDGLWNTTLNSSYRQGVYSLFSAGLTTIYNNERLSLSAGVNGTIGSREALENSAIYYPDRIWDNMNTKRNISKSINGNLALDYQYSKGSSIGFQYLGTVDRPRVEFEGLTTIQDYNGATDSLIRSNNPTMNRNYNHSLNLHHETALDTLGKKISIGADYFIYNDENDSPIESRNFFEDNIPTGTIILASNDSDQNIENLSSNIDIDLPMEALNLSFGGKVSFTTTKNGTSYLNRSGGTTITVPDQDNDFEYDENVQAIYATAQKNLGKKWSGTVGLRLENTQTKGVSQSSDGTFLESSKNSYLKFFPTINAAFKPNEANSLNLGYNRRISRPAFWELNPYRQYVNGYIYSEGNPFLQPSFTHNIQFSHSFKNKLTSSFFVSLTENGFGQIPGVDITTGEQFYTRKNYFKRTSYGFSEAYTASPFSWWKSYNQVFAFYHDIEFLSGIDLGTEPLDGFGLRFSTLNTFSLNSARTFNAEVNFWYSPGSRYQVYKSTGSSGLDLGIKWSPSENLNISAAMNDVFRQNNPVYTAFTDNTRQVYDINAATRYFRLSVQYTFGNKKITKEEQGFGNEEEQERAIKY